MAAKIEDDACSTPAQLARAKNLRANTVEFIQKAEDIRDERIAHAQSNDVGEYNIILAGLKEIKTTMTECNKAESKRAHSDLEYAYWKALESRAKGKFDPKNSGTEQTNGNGMNSLQNFKEVTKALLGMYPTGHTIHQWLKEESIKWEALAEVLFDVACFFF